MAEERKDYFLKDSKAAAEGTTLHSFTLSALKRIFPTAYILEILRIDGSQNWSGITIIKNEYDKTIFVKEVEDKANPFLYKFDPAKLVNATTTPIDPPKTLLDEFAMIYMAQGIATDWAYAKAKEIMDYRRTL